MSAIIKKTDIVRKDYKVRIERFESALEMIRTCDGRGVTDSRFDNHRGNADKDWTGVADYSEALEFLRVGYQPVVEDMRNLLKVNRHGSASRFTFQNNLVGFAPIVPLAMQGVPNNMIDMTMKKIKNKVVDIYYDMTASCAVSNDDILKNGSKLLGAVMELEAQGYRFNLYAVQSYCNSKSADVMLIKLKSSTQPLDLKRVSFPLCHTAFFRVIGFDWYSRFPEGKYRSGYGHAVYHEFYDKTQDFYRQVFGQNAVFFSGTQILKQDKDHIKEVLADDGENR